MRTGKNKIVNHSHLTLVFPRVVEPIYFFLIYIACLFTKILFLGLIKLSSQQPTIITYHDLYIFLKYTFSKQRFIIKYLLHSHFHTGDAIVLPALAVGTLLPWLSFVFFSSGSLTIIKTVLTQLA